MSVEELTKQDISIFDDADKPALEKTKRCFPRYARELHWPKLALGDTYPVTDRDGRILRHEPLKGAKGLI